MKAEECRVGRRVRIMHTTITGTIAGQDPDPPAGVPLMKEDRRVSTFMLRDDGHCGIYKPYWLVDFDLIEALNDEDVEPAKPAPSSSPYCSCSSPEIIRTSAAFGPPQDMYDYCLKCRKERI